jgi:hypothetical protein
LGVQGLEKRRWDEFAERGETRVHVHVGLLIGGILGLITPVLVAAMRREDGDWTQ